MGDLKLREIVLDRIELVRRYICTRFGRWDCLLPKFTVFNIVYYLTDENRAFLLSFYARLSKGVHPNTAKEAEKVEERKGMWLVIMLAGGPWVS